MSTRATPPEVITLRYTNVASFDVKVPVAGLDLDGLDPEDRHDHHTIGELAAESDIDFPQLGICCDGSGSHGAWHLDLGDEFELYAIEADGRSLWDDNKVRTITDKTIEELTPLTTPRIIGAAWDVARSTRRVNQSIRDVLGQIPEEERADVRVGLRVLLRALATTEK